MPDRPVYMDHNDSESGGGLSQAEFEKTEDRLDDMTRPRGLTRAVWQQRQGRTMRIAVACFVVLVIGVGIAGISGSGSAKLPSCQAQTGNCRQTADGFWVPLWYYSALSLAQGGSIGAARAPSTAGAQPSAAELEESGATSAEAGEAESYGQSAGSDASGDDSGSDGSGDDSGSDDDSGGGDDGGGDGGD